MTAADSTSGAPHPTTRRANRARPASRSRRLALIATLVALAAACTPVALPPTSTTVPPGPPAEVSMEWWAMGDSLFAGYDKHRAAPSYLDGVENFAIPGHTLLQVELLGEPQTTVREQIEAAVELHGAPEHMVIHAGVADLVGRGLWGFDHGSDELAAEIASLDEWLRGLGVDVWWTTLAPFTFWSIPGLGGQGELRLWLNDWLHEHVGDRLIDCEEALIGFGGVYADAQYLLEDDGIHVNSWGARRHARCISEQLAEQGYDLPVLTEPR